MIPTIDICSDLHLDWENDDGRAVVEMFPGGDILIAAGDLADGGSLRQWQTREVFEELIRKYDKVVIVAGNHDHYRSGFNDLRDNIFGHWKTLWPEKFVFLDREIVEIEGVRIIGATLWFPDDHARIALQQYLSDFKYISKFSPRVFTENAEDTVFLNENANDADIIVTHHLPSNRCVDAQFHGDALNIFYVSPMDELLDYGLDTSKHRAWIHGHTHCQVHVPNDNVTIFANPRGYSKQNPDWTPKRLIKTDGVWQYSNA